MIRDIVPFGLRIPHDVKTRIEQAAVANKRSLNSEMLVRLDKSFESSQLLDYRDGELIAELMRRYGRGEIYIRVGRHEEDPPLKP